MIKLSLTALRLLMVHKQVKRWRDETGREVGTRLTFLLLRVCILDDNALFSCSHFPS